MNVFMPCFIVLKTYGNYDNNFAEAGVWETGGDQAGGTQESDGLK